MTNQDINNTKIDWEEIILCLQVYTRKLVKEKGWFRGEETTTFLEGKEINDYVFSAIEKYLRNPEKYDSTKRSLVEYLKKHIIRSLVSNDLVSAENKTTIDLFSYENNNEDDDEDSAPYLDSILPYVEAFFDQEIDYKQIMNCIETLTKGDTIVENIFLGISGYGMKRAEIIKEFKMTENEFDNGMRRLITIRNKVAQQFNISKCSL